jgi:electron transport complex protein RnfC
MRRGLLGGVHFSASPGSFEPIVDAPVPGTAILPAYPSPFSPMVRIGDSVLAGQLLGYCGDGADIPVHSTISGTVASIDEHPMPSGTMQLSVSVTASSSPKKIVFRKSTTLDPSNRLKEFGIVPENSNVRLLILNATCDEPMISSTYRLIVEKTAEILSGLGAALSACGADKARIAVDRRDRRIVRLIRNSNRDDRISIVPVTVRYPMNQNRLILALNADEHSDSCRMLSVHQTVDFHEISKGRPVLERVVSVTGDGVSRPGNVRVRIGTPMRDVIDFCGGNPDETVRIVAGNPLTSLSVTCEAPVTVDVTGIVVFRNNGSMLKEKPCISCARCRMVCPARLDPKELDKKILSRSFDGKIRNRLMRCLSCGLCGFICPSKRNLFARLSKAKLSLPLGIVES